MRYRYVSLLPKMFGMFCVLGAWVSSAESRADSFSIKPYLFSRQGQAVGVGWQYDSTPSLGTPPVAVELYNGAGLVATVPAETEDGLYFAFLPIPVCDFGDSLTYRVSGQSTPSSIVDIPCATSTEPARFTFMADTQEGTEFDRGFAEQATTFPGEAILNGGDLVQKGSDYSAWVGFFDAMSAVGGSRILFPAVGNHEYEDDPAVPLWQHFFRFAAKDAHYAYDLGPARVIALNSNFHDDPTQRDAELDWLKAELSIPSRWKIIYFHHPAYSVGVFNGPLAPKKEHIVLQDYFVPLFEQYGVDLVLNGHVHLFETSLKNNVHYITVGPAGGKFGYEGARNPYQLKEACERTVLHIEAASDHLRALSTTLDNRVLDDLILRKP